MSNKRNLVLYVDQELVEKSRNFGFNLSKTFENHLKHLTTRFSVVNSVNSYDSTSKDGDWWAEPDATPKACATIITHVDHGKTSLSDSLLAQDGLMNIRDAGQKLKLDDDEVEQKRQMTVYSSYVTISYKHNSAIANTDFMVQCQHALPRGGVGFAPN